MTLTDRVRWGIEGFVFEIQSTDATLIAASQGIFDCWPAPADAAPAAAWTLIPGGDGYRIQPGIDIPGGRVIDRARSAVEATIAIEVGAVHTILESPGDTLCVHGALVSRRNAGILIVGPSGAGKSTLACALWSDGWSLLCDDVTMIAGSEAMPTPRRVSLRRDSQSLLDPELLTRMRATGGFMETAEGFVFQPRQRHQLPATRTRLAAIAFLARRGIVTGPGTAAAIPPAHAAIALLPYTNLGRRRPFAASLAAVAPLAGAVPAYDIGRSRPPDMVDTLHRLLET